MPKTENTIISGQASAMEPLQTHSNLLAAIRARANGHFFADYYRQAVFNATMQLFDTVPESLPALQAYASANVAAWKISLEAGGEADAALESWFQTTYSDAASKDIRKRACYNIPVAAREDGNDSREQTSNASVYICEGDWADVTQKLTQHFGQMFAVLNMVCVATLTNATIKCCPNLLGWV
jgi:hypothetical protein